MKRFNYGTGMVVCLVGMLMVLLAGCRQQEGEDKPRVALIMKSLANEFFVTMADGARSHQEAHAATYELIVNGIKNESDLSQQVSMVENMIATGVDAIVIAPADSRALVPVLKRAVDGGIVVINIDNKLDDEVMEETGVSIPFVGPDNRQGAEKVGTYVAGHLEAGDPVAIIGGIPTAFNAQQRQRGFEDAMYAAGMEIVSIQSGGWEQAPAHSVAAALLNEHPDIRALLCSNDNMALGAAAAVKQAGLEEQVLVAGFDNISAVRELLAEGRILATADQYGDQLAVFGIEAALDALEGETVTGVRETPVELITAPDVE